MAVARDRVQVGRVQTQIRLPADLHQALLDIAAEEERSFNGQLVHALRSWLSLQPKKVRPKPRLPTVPPGTWSHDPPNKEKRYEQEVHPS